MARKVERMDARRLYLEELLPIAEIAKRLQVPENTVYRWKTEDAAKGKDWDADREALRMTPLSALKQAMKLAFDELERMVASGKIDVRNADALTKIIKSIKSLNADVDILGNTVRVMNELSDFLAERTPETLETLEPWLLEFGQMMAKKYGKQGG